MKVFVISHPGYADTHMMLGVDATNSYSRLWQASDPDDFRSEAF